MRERRSQPFAAFDAGAALIGAGWLRCGIRAGAAIHLGAVLGGLGCWLWQRGKRM